MLDWFKSLLGVDRVVESGMKIVDKLAGTDVTGKEKIEYFLKYQEITKHQSPARRVLAFLFAIVWTLLVLTWLVSTGLSYGMNWSQALSFADDVMKFMEGHVTQPMNIIIGFYFAMSVFKK